jgi:hypothetical protein
MCQVRYSHTNRGRKEAAKENLKKAFFTGGNSSCRAHIRQHYETYQVRCKDGNVPVNHHAIPRNIFRQMKEDKKRKGGTQATLDGMLEKTAEVKTYSREGATHAIVQFVACDDQVGAGAMVMLQDDIDIRRLLGFCCWRKTYISKLPCCDEAQDDTQRLT